MRHYLFKKIARWMAYCTGTVSFLLLAVCIAAVIAMTGLLAAAAWKIPGEEIERLHALAENSRLDTLPPFCPAAFVVAYDSTYYEREFTPVWTLLYRLLASPPGKMIDDRDGFFYSDIIKRMHLGPGQGNWHLQKMILYQYMGNNFSKDTILAMYINSCYYGNNMYGIQDAAQYYFRKNAENLTVGEAAILASIVRYPFKLAGDRENIMARQQFLLRRMHECGFITTAEYDTALNSTPDLFVTPQNTTGTP